jgi:hypothetical protein
MMREVATPRGSRFLLCTMSTTDKRYSKYPPQPILRCEGYRPRAHAVSRRENPQAEPGSRGDERPASH